jgi:alpha-tubulin suppressor-like RCC1 family protein
MFLGSGWSHRIFKGFCITRNPNAINTNTHTTTQKYHQISSRRESCPSSRRLWQCFQLGFRRTGPAGSPSMENYRLNALTPSQFGLPKKRIKHISCGSYHSFAIDDRDRVYAWGLSNFGQTGIPEDAGEGNAVIQKPTIVEALADFKISEIQGGNHHSVACSEDGELLVWGRCDDAQAGISLDDLDQDDLIFDDRSKPRILIRPTTIPGRVSFHSMKTHC